jgi:hypothetical protein
LQVCERQSAAARTVCMSRKFVTLSFRTHAMPLCCVHSCE